MVFGSIGGRGWDWKFFYDEQVLEHRLEICRAEARMHMSINPSNLSLFHRLSFGICVEVVAYARRSTSLSWRTRRLVADVT